eukprot:10008319-Alexandrium_andersonii.AAC.1
MSASLVGSEMCIRDSLYPLLGVTCSFAAVPNVGDCMRVASGGTSQLSRPVSYTHLTLPTICSV